MREISSLNYMTFSAKKIGGISVLTIVYLALIVIGISAMWAQSLYVTVKKVEGSAVHYVTADGSKGVAYGTVSPGDQDATPGTSIMIHRHNIGVFSDNTAYYGWTKDPYYIGGTIAIAVGSIGLFGGAGWLIGSRNKA